MTKKKESTFKSVDKISEELDVVDNFVLRNWKKYVYIAIIIIIVFAVVLFYYEYRKKNNLQKSQEIFTARSAPELEQVIKKYPNTQAVNFSRLELAAKYFDKNEYKKARELYEEEMAKGNSDFAVNLAKLNNCYVMEALGNKADAAKNLEEIADDSAMPDLLRAEAAYSSGRILMELGKKEQAKKYLNICMTFKNCEGWSKFAKGILDDNA